jgi:multisubunit Na+/H+ antiporter MnhC subunit
MINTSQLRIVATVLGTTAPLFIVGIASADTQGVSQVNNFIKSIIQIITGIAALLAAGFVAFSGVGYITSSGNPERLDRSKRTLMFSAVGLTITLAAFVLTSTVSDLATKAFGN